MYAISVTRNYRTGRVRLKYLVSVTVHVALHVGTVQAEMHPQEARSSIPHMAITVTRSVRHSNFVMSNSKKFSHSLMKICNRKSEHEGGRKL